MMLGVVGSWVAGKHSEASREISYWAVRSEGACQARPQCNGIIGMAVEGRAGTIQISDLQTSGCVTWRALAGTLGGLQIADWVQYVRSTYW